MNSVWTYEKYEQKRAAARRRAARLRAARERGTHTEEEWMTIVVRYVFRCVRCGYGEQCTGWKPCKDHIVPITMDGSDAATNLQPLCRNCNAEKRGDTTNWAAYRDEHGWADAEFDVQ